MHVYDPRLEVIANQLSDQIAAADLMRVEAGPQEKIALANAISDQSVQTRLPDGQSLPAMLDDATWTTLSAAAIHRNIPADKAAQMQPWYLALILSLPACAATDVTAGRPAFDSLLISEAMEASTPVRALEPWNTLFQMMAAADIETQLAQLKFSAMSPTVTAAVFVAMSDRYFAGDIGDLMEITRMSAQTKPGVADPQADALFAQAQSIFVEDRNNRWMPVVAQAAAANYHVVIAVGAGHLPGERGILMLLQNDGWTITAAD